MTTRLVACLLLLTVTIAARSSAAADKHPLQGTWRTVRMVSNDMEVPAKSLRAEVTVSFEGDKMITRRKDKELAVWTFAVDDTKEPKQLTINTANPGAKPQLSHQIYKIEGDTLTTSAGRTFPKDFSTKTEQGYYLTVRERVKE